jgi:hypothetical protein
MKVRDSIYNVGNDYPQYVVLRGSAPTPGPSPDPTPEPEPGPEPEPTDPIETLDISETVDGSNMTITPNGDTSTLDHYNVNVYGG